MSQESTSHELQAQSEELLRGPLKHARTAALALALVPLAAVAVTTQTQEDSGCPASAGICGTVFYDTNGNGIQESGEPGIPGRDVTVTYTPPDGGDQVDHWCWRPTITGSIRLQAVRAYRHDVYGFRSDTE